MGRLGFYRMQGVCVRGIIEINRCMPEAMICGFGFYIEPGPSTQPSEDTLSRTTHLDNQKTYPGIKA